MAFCPRILAGGESRIGGETDPARGSNRSAGRGSIPLVREIKLSKDRRDKLVSEIREYLATNHDEEVGDLKASLLLDFFLERLGAPVYNQAIRHAQAFLQERLVDLEIDLSQPERDPPGTRPR